nr:helix-turn-helix transcriptional regulator [Neobittarella massiliensis]
MREQMDMNQRQFSEFLGIKQQTLSSYERGSVNAPVDGLKNIAQKCKVSMDWLCGLSDKQTNKVEYITYADVLRDLTEISKIFEINLDTYNSPDLGVFIHDNKIQGFLHEWRKLLALRNEKTIDDDLYSLWVDNKLNDNFYQEPFVLDLSDDDDLPF